MRDEFDAGTKDMLARRVGMRCSNPNCRRLTCGPRAGVEGAINIGVAAHITAAATNGPRYDANIDTTARKAIANGIWLCQVCAKLIDSDENHYNINMLHDWKLTAERTANYEMVCAETNGQRVLSPELAFVTQMVEEAAGGWRVQFGLANASPVAQVEVFHITPVLIFQHSFILHMEVTPHQLPEVTLADLRLMQNVHRTSLLHSGDGIFGCTNLIKGKTYRLQPHEMETFLSQFVVSSGVLAVWTIGFVVKFADSTGIRRVRTSDSVISINTKSSFSLAQYDLPKLERRLASFDDFRFYDDVTVGFRGVWQVKNRRPTTPDADGVRRIKIDPRNVKPIVEGVPCDWRRMLTTSMEFLQLQSRSYREMMPT